MVTKGCSGAWKAFATAWPRLASSPSYNLSTFRQPVEFLVGEAIKVLLAPESISVQSVLAPGSLVLRGSHRRLA
jgi:DNA-binding LacI/PurR family transcriptional regulator